jgi:4-hydroxy-tetrahydrodipicolinate synthase
MQISLDNAQPFRGIIPAVVAPYDSEGNISPAMMEKVCNFFVEKGTDGLLINGTTGEGLLLSIEERKILAKAALDAVGNDIPVMINVGVVILAESIQLAKHARENGAAGVSLICPYYYSYKKEGLFNYFSSVIEEVGDILVYLYNFPAVAGNTIEADLVQELTERFPNIAGVKDSSGSMSSLKKFSKASANPDFNVLAGGDTLLLPCLISGMAGGISGPACAFPEPYVDLIKAFRSGDFAAAQKYQTKIDLLAQTLLEGNDIDRIKKGMLWRGLDVGTVRPPLSSLTRDMERAFRADLESALAQVDLNFFL